MGWETAKSNRFYFFRMHFGILTIHLKQNRYETKTRTVTLKKTRPGHTCQLGNIMTGKLNVFVLAVTIVWCSGQVAAQTSDQYAEEARAILADTRLKTAFDSIDKSRDQILEEWTAITEINAPSGQEGQRAAFIEKLLRKYNLQSIRYDSAGNLIATRSGTGGGPTVVFDAHMDTVFQPGLKIKAVIRDGEIYAPGVGDDTRNIEALLASIRALNDAGIKTKGDLVFLFSTAEETTMGGARQFVNDNKGKIDQYVALDGGYEGFTYGGIGINWYRHHFLGPGGHTRSQTPPFSAALPLARAIERIYQLKVPNNPPSNLNIGMLGGSEVVNAKASDAWFTVDLRSTDNTVIADLDKKIALILNEEAAREGMELKTEVISASPAAILPGNRESSLVRMTEAIHIAMGFENPPITNTGSNNSSAALRAGISSISTGAGPCSNAHSLKESCEIEPFYRGIKKIIAMEIALAKM
jgi:acetylornithine deacetylase/succinyl-diaminopimelate desuccinylase-like protein